VPAPSELDTFLAALLREAEQFYGDRLVSLAVFGSHASGRARPRSDIDLMVVLTDAAPRRRLRLLEFEALEDRLVAASEAFEATGRSAELSPVIRTREEAAGFSILYLDMTHAVRILTDRDGFLAQRLERMRAELARLGAERHEYGDRWYWILKKDFRPGDVFDIS
jgi:predicted nucleotidyltransferase